MTERRETSLLGMLRILAGGFLGCGIALGALAIPVYRGQLWASWASLLVGSAVWVPTLSVAFMLKRAQSGAEPPILASAAILAIIVVAFAASIVGRRTSQRA